MGVDIPINGTFHHFFWQSDLDRSGRIDTLADVVELAKLAYESQNPEAGLDFERMATPILRKAKWTIPPIYRQAFFHLGQLHREGQKNPTKPIGWVEVQIPFSPDMAALMREYYPSGGYRRSSDGRHEFISDHHGRLLMLIVRNNQGKIVRVFSPRSRHGLRSALLYLPELPQTEFAALLGLPKPRWSDLRRYTVTRAKEFLAEPATPQSTASSNGGWQRANSIAQVIFSQLDNDPTYIGFPGFGVTMLGNGSPVLESLW